MGAASGHVALPGVSEQPESTPPGDVPDAQTGAGKASEENETQWWEEPGLPWNHKPGRADIACMTWFGVIAVFTLILLPTRVWLMAAAPGFLAMITGGRTAVAASGALASVGQMPYWPAVLAVATVLSLKFDWVYWWAGRLWGRGMIEVWAGKSKRSARNYARAERWAEKLGPLGFFIAYVPIPLPLMQVVFVLAGAAGMSLKRFLIYDYIASTVWLIGFFVLGWRLGKPVVDVLDLYAKVAGYVAIGIIVVILAGAMMRRKPQSKEG